MVQSETTKIDAAVARYRAEHERLRFDEDLDEIVFVEELNDRLEQLQSQQGHESVEARALSRFLLEIAEHAAHEG